MDQRNKNDIEPVLMPDDRYRFPHLLMVEASAGSGKTQALASRYVQFLLSDKVPHRDLSHLLAVTFTNNAAREMKQRILGWLKALALGTDDELLRQTIELVGGDAAGVVARAAEAVSAVLDRYADFQVQTIDSFSRGLYAAASPELGQRPDFDLVFRYDDLIPPALDQLLKRAGADPAFDRMTRAFLDALNRSGGGSFPWDPRPALERTFATLLEVEAREAGRLVFEDRGREIEQLAGDIIERAERIISQGSALGFQPRESPLVRDLRARDYYAACAKTISARTLPIKGKKTGDKDSERLAGQWLALAGPRARLALACSLDHNSAYGPPFELFKQELEAVKRRTGIVHIDDLGTTLARHLDTLAVPEVYLRLGSRLWHFLIDEFQDTSPMQWRTLKPLLDEALATDGSLFLVGDLKQAIYMFRRADYRIMRRLLDDIAGLRPAGEVPASVAGSASARTLETNFRSGAAIVGYVGRVFRQNLSAALGAGPAAADPTGLTAIAQRSPDSKLDLGYVRVRHLTPARPEPDGEDDGTAGQPADPVRDELLATVRDIHARGYRFRDIAILAGRNQYLERAVNWLNAAGIPVAASSSLDIRDRKVVAELASLLAFLDSPIDDLAFYGFASGGIMRRAAAGHGVALKPGDLARLMTGRGGTYAYQAFRRHPDYQVLWERCLEPLYRRAGHYPLYGLLSLALKLFRVFDHFPGESGSLIRLLETANRLEAECAATIGRFLERIAGDDGDLFSQELPEFGDAVRLLTVHKSKGLGFPVVINLLYDSAIKGETAYFRAEGDSVRYYHLRNELRAASPELAALYEESRLAGQVQKLNELYVCCTRASDELHNLVIATAPDAFFPRLFPETEAGAKRSFTAPAAGLAIPMPVSLPWAAKPGGMFPDSGPQCEAWTLARLLEARAGEAYHAVLREMEYAGDGASGEVTGIVDRLAATGTLDGIDQRTIGRIGHDVTAFLGRSPAREWFAARPGRSVLREAEFIGQDGRRVRMDRVVLDPDRVTLVDFKTGKPADHGSQIAEYRTILAALYPGRAIDAALAYVDRNVIEAVP